MPRWPIRSVSARIAQQSARGPAPGQASDLRSALTLTRLEDRVVPVLVTGYGGYTAYFDTPAGKVGVANNNAWIDVSISGTMVVVSPGPSYIDEPDGEGGTNRFYDPRQGTYTYGFSITGPVIAVQWQGPAVDLQFNTTGNVLDIQGVSGVLGASSKYGAIGNLSGGTVWARSERSSVGTVTATGDVGGVFAGTSVGAVTAGGNVRAVQAGYYTSSVRAGGLVGLVQAGLDVVGPVEAGMSIGGYNAFSPLGVSEWRGVEASWYNAGVSAGRDVRGNVTAGGGIAGVTAGRDVLGAVAARGSDVWSVRAGTANGYPSWVYRDESERGSGWEDVYGGEPDDGEEGWHAVSAPGHVRGPVTAARDVYSVGAGGNVRGRVTAQGGAVGLVSAGKELYGGVFAATDIGIIPVHPEPTAWRPSPATVNPVGYNLGTGITSHKGTVSGGIEAKAGSVFGVSAYLNVSGPVRAGQDIAPVQGIPTSYTLKAGGAVGGAVSAGRDITGVTAGVSVSGSGSAGRDIGSVYVSGVYPNGTPVTLQGPDVSARVSAGRNVGTVSAARGSVKGAVSAAAGPVASVTAAVDVSGAVSAGLDIGDVTAGRTVSGDLAAGRDIVSVRGGTTEAGDVTGDMVADRNVGKVTASRSVTGDMQAGEDFAGVTAGTSIAGRVAAGRDIGPVTVTGLTFAGQPVTAPTSMSAVVDAGRNVGVVRVVRGSLYGPVTARTGWVGLTNAPLYTTGVTADLDISGAVTAGTDIHAVSAGRAVSGNLTAGQDVVSIVTGAAARGDLAGHVKAGRHVGPVTVGPAAGGVLSGGVNAVGDIGNIVVYGTAGSAGAPATLPQPQTGLTATLWTIDAAADSYAHGSLPAARPGVPGLAAGGDITSPVVAGGRVGAVTAFGRIGGELRAGGQVGSVPGAAHPYRDVWALGDVTGAVTSGANFLAVQSWGRVGGAVSAAGPAYVWAFGDVAGGVTSTAGGVTAGSWAGVSGGVAGHMAVDIRAFADAGGGAAAAGVTSATGPVTVWAGGSAGAAVDAHGYAAVFARTGVTASGVRSVAEDVYVETRDGDIAIQGSLGGGAGGARAKDLVWLTAGRDISVTGATSSDGGVAADAARAILGLRGAADRNVWAAARDGSLTLHMQAAKGWAYAWAAEDIRGSVESKLTASATAWRNVAAAVTSTGDGAEVFAGADVTGAVTGAMWAVVETRGTVSGATTAGTGGYYGDAVVRAGRDVTGPVTANGEADVAAEGSVRANVRSTEDDVIVVANGDVVGDMVAELLAEVMAGGSVGGSVVAQEEVNVEGKTGVSARTESVTGTVSLWSGAGITGSVKAGYEAIVEAVGAVSGGVTADYTASVVAGGDITGRVEAEWLADVRSAAGEVTGEVVTRKGKADRLGDANSPTRRRLAVIDARLQAMAANPPADPAARQALEAEREVHTLQDKSLDFQKVPADVVRAMIADGLAKEETGPPLRVSRGVPGLPDRVQSVYGYVVTADVVGTDGYTLVLEPYKHYYTLNPDTGVRDVYREASALGEPLEVTFYKVVRRQPGVVA